MKYLWKWLPLVWLLAGCLSPGTSGSVGEVQLTPYIPALPSETAPAPSPTPVVSPTPQATPTPFLHTVALSESISAIALRYGVSMDAIMAANPDVDPNTMVVGMQLVIPGVQSSAVAESLMPVSVQVTEPACLPTSRGGWWCTAWVLNDQAIDVSSISITFTLADASGGQLTTFNTPTLLDWLPPSGSIPASAFFPPPIQPDSRVTTALLSAVAMDAAAARFLPVEVQVDQVTIENRLAQVSGSVILPADNKDQISAIWLAALAYDQDGNLVGARRITMPPAVSDGGETGFNIYVYSANPVIDRVELLAEAHLQ